ncbi:MAG: Holliday junction resolvase RuvX [bacterium]|nr:Holliday junction resolvase RuvX [bacterium]
MKKRILAIDYGRKRMGVAVSDGLGITAQMLPTLVIKSMKDALNRLKKLAEEYDLEEIVFGLPLDMYGKSGEMAEEVKKFGSSVNKATGINTEYFDERFTSKQAETAMHQMGEKTGKKKAKIDSLSAVFLLQSYLDYKSVKKG